MSANNQIKQNNKDIELPAFKELRVRKQSIDPSAVTKVKLVDSSTDWSKLHKIIPGKNYNIPKIEQWKSTQSKDGMNINLLLNIKFNLKRIMV